MKVLNYEVKFSVERRHSFWDLLRTQDESGDIIHFDLPPIPPKWELEITPEKRMRVMHSEILKYAFRDVALKITSFPDEAPAIFLGIVAFTETFKNNMILKGADEKSIAEYDCAVDAHIESTLNIVKRNNPEIYNNILDCLEDE